LHDYSNSYFPALLATENAHPESIVFDIYQFNKYAWGKGYHEVLIDFYLNSPFTSTFFYPFALIEDAYFSKAIFNGLSILLFLTGIFLLSKKHLKDKEYYLLLLPFIFIRSIQNNILFGQSYFIVFFLVVTAYVLIEKNRQSLGVTALSLAAFIKIFPVFYGLPFLFSKQWKTIGYGVVITGVLIFISIYISGIGFWKVYLLEVLPNAIANESTTDFWYSSQSIDVFLRTLFIADEYYNPNAIFDSYKSYKILGWIIKSVVIGIAIQLSFRSKDKLFELLSIWIVVLFLTQTRTATYAQILWIIPSITVIINSSLSKNAKLFYFAILFLVANFPFHWLEELQIVLRFSRMWLSILLAVIFFLSFKQKVNYKYIVAISLLLLPLNLKAIFYNENQSNSEYVINEKKHFMIYDFEENNGSLLYHALGRNGDETVIATININSFDSTLCEIIDNQVYYQDIQLTFNKALKKKPILINGCEVYYLTDHHSRRAAFTMKKIDVCGLTRNY